MGLEMARKERGEFVFSAFSSFLLAWPVRRLVMHDRCRYVYSVGCTRSGAKHRRRRVLFASLRSPHPRPISLAKREEHRVSFHIRFQVSSVEVRAQEIQKIGQSDRLPSIVLQMNDQLESHKPFFTAEADPWGERRENFKNHPWFLPIDCNFILINFSAV